MQDSQHAASQQKNSNGQRKLENAQHAVQNGKDAPPYLRIGLARTIVTRFMTITARKTPKIANDWPGAAAASNRINAAMPYGVIIIGNAKGDIAKNQDAVAAGSEVSAL
jgi:hypothetical protein